MFKLLIAGILGIAATAGGWFAGQMLAASKSAATEDKTASIMQVATDMTGAPILVDGHVQGYVVFRIQSQIDKSKLVDPKFDVAPFLTGAAFEATFRYFDKGVPNIKPNDIPALTAMILEIANKRLGDKIVQDVELEQFNYVASDKIRQNLFPKSP